MFIYVCYYEYDEKEWDNCSHPVCFFLLEIEAMAWKKTNGDNAIYQTMQLGKTYYPR